MDSESDEGDHVYVHRRRDRKQPSLDSGELPEKPRPSHQRRSRRRSTRHYASGPPIPSGQTDGHVTDQDSDDLLDDYYGGAYMPQLMDSYPGAYDPPHRMSSRPTGRPPGMLDPEEFLRPSRPTSMPQPPPSSDGSPLPGQSSNWPPPPRFSPYVPTYRPPPMRRHTDIIPSRRQGYIEDPPHRNGIWGRAAVFTKGNAGLRITLKLVLSRHGERYKSHGFIYEEGTWDDFTFARQLKQEYRRLKTDHIGIMQKLTSYKTISFVYFLQYHAFHDPRFRGGKWQISEKKPIMPRDDDKGRAFFMFQLRKKSRRVSKLFSTVGEERRLRHQRRNREWVNSLDELIEPGAVIDLEIKETFDSIKIYVGLLLAILLSLGAALGYGFAMDNDFSTGFSIASWLITAFGFFAAVVAAGEYFGLDSPTMTLWEADELDKGVLLPPEIYRDTR